jgi:pseudaminic acid synthase
MGSVAPILSIALGAKIIEKHFILDKSIGGPDASFSMDQDEFAEMVKSIRQAEVSLGNVDYTLTKKQEKNRVFSRSLFAVEDIEAGEKITKKNVRSIRPGYGLHPKYFKKILQTKVVKKLKKGDPLDASYLDLSLD